MLLSIKRSVILVLLACTVSGAFLMGQRLGADAGQPLRHIGHLLSADASGSGDFGMGGMAISPQDENVSPQDIFENVLDHVQRDYVRSYGGSQRLSNGALTEMFASLNDPRTYYLNPEMRKAYQAALQGKFYGIGAVLTITQSKQDDVDYRYLTVMDVMPGSPAAKIGLKSGDHITEIDGHWIIAYSIESDMARIRTETDEARKVAEAKQTEAKFKVGYSVSKALEKLTEGEGKAYKLTVTRAGQAAPLPLNVTTAVTQVDPVEYRTLGGGIGYLRIRQFNSRATEEFEKALAGASAINGLIVDLRQNPGGVTAEAVTGVDGYSSARELIAWLTPGGTVATLERRPNQREPLKLKPLSERLRVPLIVLMDSGTDNLSEMVAAALRDAGKAKLIGVRTFGDDVLPLFATLKNGSGFEIATAHLLTIAGTDLNQGMKPDIDLGLAAVDTDIALQRAVALGF